MGSRQGCSCCKPGGGLVVTATANACALFVCKPYSPNNSRVANLPSCNLDSLSSSAPWPSSHTKDLVAAVGLCRFGAGSGCAARSGVPAACDPTGCQAHTTTGAAASQHKGPHAAAAAGSRSSYAGSSAVRWQGATGPAGLCSALIGCTHAGTAAAAGRQHRCRAAHACKSPSSRQGCWDGRAAACHIVTQQEGWR